MIAETIARWWWACCWMILSLFIWDILVVDPEGMNSDVGWWAWVMLIALWIMFGIMTFKVGKRR